MTYIDGFLAAVPEENRQAYLDHAQAAWVVFKEHGATRMVENWADDVPVGKVTDFHRSVERQEGEAVLFSWVEWPSKASRDAGMQALMEDERMQKLEMPFDGQRMVMGGFAPMVEVGSPKGLGYADCYVLPVLLAKRDAYEALARLGADVFAEHGANRTVECWGDDVPEGKRTDFRRAVAATDAETIVFSWTEWPSKAARDAAWPKIMEDPRMQPDKETMPFDGKRMIYGGFTTILDA